MTVCIATDIFYPHTGGIAAYYKYLSDLLTAAGHTVILLTIDEEASENDPDTINTGNNFTKVILGATYAKYRDRYAAYFRPGSYGAPGWIAMGKAMHEWLREYHVTYKIDIIEIADYGGSGIFLADNELPPVMVIGHSSFTQLARYNHIQDDDHAAVIKELEQLSFEHCAAVTSHSPMNVEELKKLSGRTVHFTRAPWIVPAPPTRHLNDTPGNNLVVGGLQMTKGAALMAEASRLIVKEKKSWKIHWTGGETHSAPGGKKMSDYLSENYADTWNRHFIWDGKKEHGAVLSSTQAAGLVIIPSLWETFNYFALEAAYLQKPLVITQKTGASYLFENDSNIIIVPAGSAIILADTLLHRCTDEWKNSITPDTKNRLIEYFSPANIIEERLKVYATVIKKRRPYSKNIIKELGFINKYMTKTRKLYYTLRRTAKKIIKGE